MLNRKNMSLDTVTQQDDTRRGSCQQGTADDALAQLLEANGYDAGDKDACSSITELEMFLVDYPKMVALHHFPNLRELRLIEQRLAKIEGLHGCPQLQKLWLTENRISQISGLEGCTALEELYLTSNRISAIQGVAQLSHLRVLWLADNYISSVDGLGSLSGLQQLNLARNDIHQLGGSFTSSSSSPGGLTSLNLAANRVSSLQDAAGGLRGLTRLQELCLADPFFGDCPVTGLCNYQTYMLAALPHLTNLDTLVIAEETRAAAATTYAKKRLYYSMRTRTLQRAAGDLVQQAKAGLQVGLALWDQLHARLAYAAQCMQCMQDQHQGQQGQLACTQKRGLMTIQSLMQAVLRQRASLQDSFTAACRRSAAGLQEALARLQLELGSAGNIWLEQARPGDAWLHTCQELLAASRMAACAGFSTTSGSNSSSGGGSGSGCTAGIKIVSAVRIHNRHLRTRFNRASGSCVTTTSSSSSNIASSGRSSDVGYLFYMPPPSLEGQLLRVAQQGFQSCCDHDQHAGQGTAVRLATCINLAAPTDAGSLLPTATSSGSSGSSGSCPTTMMQVLVCKAFMGGAARAAAGPPLALDAALGPQGSVSAEQYPGMQAVFQTVIMDNSTGSSSSTTTTTTITSSSSCQAGSSSNRVVGKQQSSSNNKQHHRIWHFLEPAAVLPEFLVTFQYFNAPAGGSSGSNSSIESCTAAARPSAGICDDPLLCLCQRPLQPWLNQAPDQRQQQQHRMQPTDFEAGSGGGGSGVEACQLYAAAAAELMKQCEAVLATQGPLTCKKLPRLSRLALCAHAGVQELGAVTYLSLQDAGLHSCAGLAALLPRVVHLVLSFNSLTSLAGLAPETAAGQADTSGITPLASCFQLTSLDVSHNRLSTWDGQWLQGCGGSLQVLDASFNCLAQPSELQQLSQLSQLQQLNLTANPVQQHKAYHMVLTALAHLTQLDGQPHAEQPLANNLNAGLLQAGATLWHSDGAGPVPGLTSVGSQDWRHLVHSVVLDEQLLASSEGLAAAPNLVAVSLRDNLLTDVSGLQGCTALQQLSLAGNLITQLSALSGLTSLQQLDVSGNHVSSLAPLSRLTRLSQLSVEGNMVDSLAPLTDLVGLVELYAANNCLANAQEAERLVVLPGLAVLDLSGNPTVTATEGYRLRLLYRLPRLKVLDGCPASAEEVAAAHTSHAGRLTLSMLEAHTGTSAGSLAGLQQLNASKLGIRSLGTVFAASGQLTRLTSVVLDNNHISSLGPLATLTRLVSLSLNSNRLGEAPPGSIAFAEPAAATSASDASTAGAPGNTSVVAGTTGNTTGRAQGQPVPLLPSLQVLHLAGNSLSSLVPLQLRACSGLRSLFVQGNELGLLEGLEGLVHLRELVADNNKLRVFEPAALSSLVRLTELRLEHNCIRGIATPTAAPTTTSVTCYPASGGEVLGACLPSLVVLHLGSNRLADEVDCAEKLSGLPCLQEVSLANNPLARKQAYRATLISHCTQLQVVDGQPVTQEEWLHIETSLASPRRSVELPQVNADMLLAAAADSRAAAVAAAAANSPGTWNVLGGLVGPPSSRSSGPNPRPQAQGAVPSVLNYDALVSMAARHGMLGVGTAGGLQLQGSGQQLQASVPSIQSGVLILTGSASFGLSGTAIINNSSSSGSSSTSKGVTACGSPPRMVSKQHSSLSPGAVAAGSSPNRRTTTGSIATCRAGGFTINQATLH